jgi:hypothetical protein
MDRMLASRIGLSCEIGRTEVKNRIIYSLSSGLRFLIFEKMS